MKREEFESICRALAPVFAADREAAKQREAALREKIVALEVRLARVERERADETV